MVKQAAFLAILAESANIREACEKAGITRGTYYDWMKKWPEFVALKEMALEEAADRVEAEIRRRGVEGVDEPVFWKGQEVATIRKYSDTLLMFWAKSLRPEKFRDRHHVQIDVAAHSTVVIDVMERVLSDLDLDDERRTRAEDLVARYLELMAGDQTPPALGPGSDDQGEEDD